MRLLLSLLFLLLSGCAMFEGISYTPTVTTFVDPLNRDEATKVIDTRQCLVVTGYWHGDPRYDNDFYWACMTKKGYTTVTRNQ